MKKLILLPILLSSQLLYAEYPERPLILKTSASDYAVGDTLGTGKADARVSVGLQEPNPKSSVSSTPAVKRDFTEYISVFTKGEDGGLQRVENPGLANSGSNRPEAAAKKSNGDLLGQGQAGVKIATGGFKGGQKAYSDYKDGDYLGAADKLLGGVKKGDLGEQGENYGKLTKGFDGVQDGVKGYNKAKGHLDDGNYVKAGSAILKGVDGDSLGKYGDSYDTFSDGYKGFSKGYKDFEKGNYVKAADKFLGGIDGDSLGKYGNNFDKGKEAFGSYKDAYDNFAKGDYGDAAKGAWKGISGFFGGGDKKGASSGYGGEQESKYENYEQAHNSIDNDLLNASGLQAAKALGQRTEANPNAGLGSNEVASNGINKRLIARFKGSNI